MDLGFTGTVFGLALACFALTGCVTDEGHAAKPEPAAAIGGATKTSARGLGYATRPFPMNSELRFLASSCISYLETGTKADLTPQGYKFSGGFAQSYFKGIHRKDFSDQVQKDELVSASLGYEKNKCFFSSATMGGPGDEQPFMQASAAIADAALQGRGYQKRSYHLNPKNSGDVWVKAGKGYRLYVTGSPGAATARVEIITASDAVLAAVK